jgi:uncharacterized protein
VAGFEVPIGGRFSSARRGHAAEHNAYLRQFLPDGALLMIGPFSDPREGAMGIFATRYSVETLAARDPFALHAVVSRWYVREWMESISPD